MLGRRHWIILLAFIVIFLLGTARSKGEIRCYCNLPVCVGTGYMCKSSLGVCFSETAGASRQADPGKSRHGCAELMSQSRRDACLQRVFGEIGVGYPSSGSASTGVAAGGAVANMYPYLGCCREDMCNYPDSVDIKIRINARVNHSQTAAAGLPSTVEESEFIFGAPPPPEDATKRDLWFKAAVIAVPIAGGFILVLLVLVAVHMLRRDHRHHRQVVELRQQYKAHLLVDEDHVIAAAAAAAGALIDKNEQHAKLNKMAAVVESHAANHQHRHHQQHRNSSSSKPQNNVYRNVNVTICRDGSSGVIGGHDSEHGRVNRDRYAGKVDADVAAVPFRSAVTVSWNGGCCVGDISKPPSTRV